MIYRMKSKIKMHKQNCSCYKQAANKGYFIVNSNVYLKHNLTDWFSIQLLDESN